MAERRERRGDTRFTFGTVLRAGDPAVDRFKLKSIISGMERDNEIPFCFSIFRCFEIRIENFLRRILNLETINLFVTIR